MFTNFYTTVNGQRYIARSLEDGKKLVLTKSAFGKGVMPSGSYPVSAEDLISKLGEMTFKIKEASGNEYKITTNFSNYINKKIIPAFHLTEMGIYGKIQNSDGSTDADYPEKLIFYGCCSEEEADYIPATLTEFIINWSVAISGDATIETSIDESLVYASQADMGALDRATFDGYHKSIGTLYSGPAGDYGINVGKIEGRSMQYNEPTPNNPSPINSFGGGDLTFRSHGFQLFDASKLATKTTGEATVTNNGDGSFTISGSGTMSTPFSMQYTLTHKEFVDLFKAGRLTIDCGVKTRPALFFQVTRVIDGVSKWVIDWNNAQESSGTFEITKEMLDDPESTVRISIYAGTGNAIVPGTMRPMIYQDGDGTWEPFRELQKTIVPIPKRLRSLPNGVCDTYEDGKITRRVGMLYLKGDSTEAWNVSTSYDNTYYIRKPSDMRQASVVMCDRYKYVFIDADTSQDKVVFTGNFINFKDSGFASVNEFKTWLASNPITVLYELEVPVLETLKIPTIPSWAPNTAVHYNTLETPIEWHIKNGVGADHTHDVSSIKGAFAYARRLTSEDDLNNLTETGVYTYLTNSIPKNCPYNNAGTVEVIGTGSSSGTKQVVTRYGAAGESRFRMQYEGDWQDWERYAVYKDHTTLGFSTVVKPSVGKSYQSIEKNGVTYKGAVVSGNAFPNGVFLIALNSESSGGSSLYLVALGPTLESAPAITRLSVIYDNTPYPCLDITQSGYLYTSWSADKTADIRVNIFKLV